MDGRTEHEFEVDKKIKIKLENKPYYLNEWYKNLRANDMTLDTCRDYINKVSKFLDFISEKNNIYISDVLTDMFTLDLIDEYFSNIRYKIDKNGDKVRTSDSYFITVRYALSNFFDFLVKRNYVEKNYIKENVRSITNKDKERIDSERVILTKEDFIKIQTYAKEKLVKYPISMRQIMYYRDYAIIILFMHSGIRCEELREINIEDIDFENNRLKLITKGGKNRYVIIQGECKDAIKNWLKFRTIALLHLDKESDSLFISKYGKRPNKHTIIQIIAKNSYNALGYSISPHKLRAGCITILYNETKDIEFCRKFIGHTSVTTTQRYIMSDRNEKQRGADILNEIFK